MEDITPDEFYELLLRFDREVFKPQFDRLLNDVCFILRDEMRARFDDLSARFDALIDNMHEFNVGLHQRLDECEARQ